MADPMREQMVDVPGEELPLDVVQGESFNAKLGPLIEALAAAQGEFPTIERTRTVKVKTRDGGEYEFAYAPLDKIVEGVRGPLSKNALAVVQVLRADRMPPELVTRLLHKSGGVLESTVQIVSAEKGPQAFGSALTYFRRYAISALLGIVTEEDDDANMAEGNRAQHREEKPKAGRAAWRDQPATEKQLGAIGRGLRAKLGAETEDECSAAIATLLGVEVAHGALTGGMASDLLDKLKALPDPQSRPAAKPEPPLNGQTGAQAAAAAPGGKLSFLRKLARQRFKVDDDDGLETAMRGEARLGEGESISTLSAERAESLIQWLMKPPPKAVEQPAGPGPAVADTAANRTMLTSIVRQLADVVAAHPDKAKARVVLEVRDDILWLTDQRELDAVVGIGGKPLPVSDLTVGQLTTIQQRLGRAISGRD